MSLPGRGRRHRRRVESPEVEGDDHNDGVEWDGHYAEKLRQACPEFFAEQLSLKLRSNDDDYHDDSRGDDSDDDRYVSRLRQACPEFFADQTSESERNASMVEMELQTVPPHRRVGDDADSRSFPSRSRRRGDDNRDETETELSGVMDLYVYRDTLRCRRRDVRRCVSHTDDDLDRPPPRCALSKRSSDTRSLPDLSIVGRSVSTEAREGRGQCQPDIHVGVEPVDVTAIDVEVGRRHQTQESREEFDCGPTRIPFLREIVNWVVHRAHHTKDHWPAWSLQKRLVLVLSVLFVVCLVLVASLLPASFVYVDYHEMGFFQNRVTGVIDYDRVYPSGCYLVSPNQGLVLLPATAHFLDLDLQVMNTNGLTVGLEVNLQYFLRPTELSQLYRKYHDAYQDVIYRVAESAVKNMAVDLSMEDLRLHRPAIEAKLFAHTRRVLSGNCCENRRFQSPNHSVACDASPGCGRGLHVDVAYFQMGKLSIPEEVLAFYQRQAQLEVEEELERYRQDKAIQVKLTEVKVQAIHNKANEVRKAAEAESRAMKMISEASRLREVERSYIAALKKTYGLLNLTREEDKTRLVLMNTLKDVRDNLVAFGYGYEGGERLWTP